MLKETTTAQWIKSLGTPNIHTIKAIYNGLLVEMTVTAVYSQYICLRKAKENGGSEFIHLTWEELEYPRYSIAARAAVAVDAAALYPIDEKTGESKRKKNEALRQTYVNDHWQDVYNEFATGMQKFEARQTATVDWKQYWVNDVSQFSSQLLEANKFLKLSQEKLSKAEETITHLKEQISKSIALLSEV